jgi:hypothetical protein
MGYTEQSVSGKAQAVYCSRFLTPGIVGQRLKDQNVGSETVVVD